jgi:hypothetical protein
MRYRQERMTGRTFNGIGNRNNLAVLPPGVFYWYALKVERIRKRDLTYLETPE